MFSKRCPHCEAKVEKDYNFCPNCSNDLKSKFDKEDYGFLGKNDMESEDMNLTDTFIEKMFNSAMKLFEKQMKNLQNDMNNQGHHNKDHRQNPNMPGLNVQFFVNGERVLPERRDYQPVKIRNDISKEKLKMFAKLPKKEPESRIKRLSGKVIYELLVPGVNNIDDVLINQLENSIEIKALSKDKVYSKNLNVNLPILRYQLFNDNLIIEMMAK